MHIKQLIIALPQLCSNTIGLSNHDTCPICGQAISLLISRSEADNSFFTSSVMASELQLEKSSNTFWEGKEQLFVLHSFRLSHDGKLTSVGADLPPLLRNGQLRPCVSSGNLPSFVWRESQ